MIEEFTYQLQVSELTARVNISKGRARDFIKTYRRNLKEALVRGSAVVIPGWAKIWPGVRRGVKEVIKSKYEYKDQVNELAEKMEWDEFYTRQVLKTYLRMLKDKNELGYSVRVSGVVFICPEKDVDGDIYYTTRLSPSLEKPENVELFEEKEGQGEVKLDLEKETLIYRMDLDDKLCVPKSLRYVEDELFEIPTIDDAELG